MKKITEQTKQLAVQAITETLRSRPGISRKETILGALSCFPLTPKELKDPSPDGKANLIRSYIGTALTDLIISGEVQKVGWGLVLAGEELVIIGETQCRAAILSLLDKNCGYTKCALLSALEKHFGTDQTALKLDDDLLRKTAAQALSSLMLSGEIVQKNGFFSVRVHPISSRNNPCLPEENFRAAFLARLHEKGGMFFESFLAGALEKYYVMTGRDVLFCDVTGGSADGGVDIIIRTQDGLGFRDTVMVQAKCRESIQATEKEVREFLGAMTAQGGTRGIFATTAGIHPGAQKFLDSVPNCVGIDGEKLFEILKRTSYGLRKTQDGFRFDTAILG